MIRTIVEDAMHRLTIVKIGKYSILTTISSVEEPTWITHADMREKRLQRCRILFMHLRDMYHFKIQTLNFRHKKLELILSHTHLNIPKNSSFQIKDSPLTLIKLITHRHGLILASKIRGTPNIQPRCMTTLTLVMHLTIPVLLTVQKRDMLLRQLLAHLKDGDIHLLPAIVVVAAVDIVVLVVAEGARVFVVAKV